TAVQALLPWYVNGRLDAAEQAEVEAHLAGCPRCRAELALERQLQALLAPPEAAPAGADAERGLAVLRRRIAAEAPRAAAAAAGGRRARRRRRQRRRSRAPAGAGDAASAAGPLQA